MEPILKINCGWVECLHAYYDLAPAELLRYLDLGFLLTNIELS